MEILLLVLNIIAYTLSAITIFAAVLLGLRVLVSWLSPNPFAWLPYTLRRITEPLVIPFRALFQGYYLRFDLIPLVAAALILFGGLFISHTIWSISYVLSTFLFYASLNRLETGVVLSLLIMLLALLYKVAIFLRLLLPYFGVGTRSAFMRFIYAITEPLLRPLRRLFTARMFDLSPLIAIILIDLVVRIIVGFIGPV